jgi:hypothetical protein
MSLSISLKAGALPFAISSVSSHLGFESSFEAIKIRVQTPHKHTTQLLVQKDRNKSKISHKNESVKPECELWSLNMSILISEALQMI